MIDPIFKIALGISILFHAAIIVPYSLSKAKTEMNYKNEVAVNYIIINDPQLTEDKEILKETSSDVPVPVTAAPEKEITYNTAYIEEKCVEPILEPGMTDPGAESQVMDERAQEDRKQQAFLEYNNLLREKIRAAIHSYRSRKEEGLVTAVFTLTPDGYLSKVNRITATNLSPDMRRKAINGIKKAQPFASFPDEMGRDPISFSLTIKFLTK